MSADIALRSVGWKVFHFGVSDDYKGRWLQAGHAPGFHVWCDRQSAASYQQALAGGEILRVLYHEAKPITEPHGPAVTAKFLYIPPER